MIQVEIDTMIERSSDAVFDRLVDISNYSNWLPQSSVFLDTKQTSKGPVDVGTTFIDRTTIGTYRGEVTEFERPTKVCFRMRLRWFGIDVMESRPYYLLKPVEGGTQVHHRAEGQMYGIFKLFQPYVAKKARNERQRTVAVLKQSLESSPHPSGEHSKNSVRSASFPS